MKKIVLVALFFIGAGAFSTAGAQPTPAPEAGPAAAESQAVDDGKAAGAPHAAAKQKSGFRKWWRNRQIERGPRALRPGHHRRLLREGR